jgi:hypothetical protein
VRGYGRWTAGTPTLGSVVGKALGRPVGRTDGNVVGKPLGVGKVLGTGLPPRPSSKLFS